MAKRDIFLVAIRIGETPVHISNTMVKPYPAWDTALATVWESRWLPGFLKMELIFLPDKVRQSSGNTTFLRYLMAVLTTVKNSFFENRI